MRTKGTKHISTAITHFSLGLTLLKTCKPTETLEAVALLTKAGKILRRVAAEDDPRLLAYAQTLERAQAALACAVKNIFASVILSVAGKIHPEILRLMWVMADMQTLKFFNLVGDEDDIGSATRSVSSGVVLAHSAIIGMRLACRCIRFSNTHSFVGTWRC